MAIDFQPHKQPINFKATGPVKTPFSGVHFSDNEISNGVIEGNRRGSSPDSSDAHRLHVGDGAPSGVHAYRESFIGHPQITKRKFAHKITGNKAISNIDDSTTWKNTLNAAYKGAKDGGADEATAHGHAINAAEHALKEQGWDGYSSKSHPHSVLLFGDQPISRPSPSNT